MLCICSFKTLGPVSEYGVTGVILEASHTGLPDRVQERRGDLGVGWRYEVLGSSPRTTGFLLSWFLGARKGRGYGGFFLIFRFFKAFDILV